MIKHNSLKNGIWVTWKEGVYDVTKFMDQHPGGPVAFMKAAGGPVDEFWSDYRLHYEPRV